MDRFRDLFDAQRYAEEEPIGIGLASRPLDDWLFIPEPTFARVLAVGSAYRLHVLGQVLTPGQSTVLNPLQCEQLIDELNLVAHVLADPLVAKVVPQILERAATCARSHEERLVIDLE